MRFEGFLVLVFLGGGRLLIELSMVGWIIYNGMDSNVLMTSAL